MATTGASLLPSKEKTNFLTLTALIIDGGRLALKTQFDAVFPPLNLGKDLQAHQPLVYSLKIKGIICQPQYSLLYPPSPTVADSSNFDVTLLACLIQSLPVFGQNTSPIWKQSGPPVLNDITLAADVKRLRILRNYVRTIKLNLEFETQYQCRGGKCDMQK